MLADEALRLAVACERLAGISWQDIGERLGTTRQSAHERYAAVVDDVAESILFPQREGEPGQLGWWACPDGLDDPDRTAASLDAWVLRHRERTAPTLTRVSIRSVPACAGARMPTRWRRLGARRRSRSGS